MTYLLYLLLMAIFFSTVFWLATMACVIMFMRSGLKPPYGTIASDDRQPSVSLIKPVCGLEKNLQANLATACQQDYPNYEVIFAVQSHTDAALRIIENVKAEFPEARVKVVVDDTEVGFNGKVNNLHNAARRAVGAILVVSDSDMHLSSDYLQHIVTPLQNSRVGIACTLYRAWRPDNLYEALELLTYNSDFVPAMLFAHATRSSVVCPGATMAIRTEVLEKVGGLKVLGDYFVEDYELGRRVVDMGYDISLLPHSVKMDVDLSSFTDWWRHQIYWDHNTKAVNPVGFVLTVLVRGIPLALLYVLLGGKWGGLVLAGTIGFRLATGIVNAAFLKDRDGLKMIWLLPIRDLAGLFVWLTSLFKRRTRWRGNVYTLTKGKMVPVK